MAQTRESVQQPAMRTASPHSPDSDHATTTREATRPHPGSSSPGSSPSPSNPSHPSSPTGDDARHGTSPATSVDGMPMPPSGLKLDLSSHTAQSRQEQQASLSRAGVARSPHPLDGSQEARASLAARSGGILATMQEEGSGFSESRRGSTLGFEPNPSYSHIEQAIRASRHRSASSAAALALHGGTTPFADRWGSNAAGRIAPTTAAASRTLWEGANVDAIGSGNSSSGASQRSFPPLQRGFSASIVRSKPETASPPPPFLSSPAGLRDLGFDFTDASLRTSRTGLNVASSPFDARPDLPDLSSYPETGEGAGEEWHRPSAGTESRRHSVAGSGSVWDPAGVIGSHRRAIGFDMTSNGHRDYTGQTVNDQRAWPRAVSHGRDRSVSSVLPGFNPFAGGSLALSVDDLAADREYDATARDSAATARNASSAGAHEASSMPSDFYDRGVESFDTRSRGFTDASQPRNHRGGRDSLSVSWDAMTPSHAVAQSPGDGQRTLAEMTRQLRQMSMGGGELQMRSQPSGVASIFDSQEGTRTVRASPGTSPTGIRGSSSATPSMGHGLSAQAKAFTASQPLGRMSQDQLGSTGYAGVGPGDMPTYGFPTPLPTASSGFVPPMASAPPFIPAQHQLNFGASAVGLPAPAPSAAAMASALALSNDLTFSSLAALGPMPPSSMGPPLPMGGIGGAPFGAGTTSELQDLGKGVPLTSLSKDTPLYIVEFKQGRTDLFFRSKSPPHSPTVRDQDAIRRGDLVIVEADRGKDLGTVVNDSITVEQVQAFLAHQSDLTIGAATSGAASVHGPTGLLTGAGSGDETSSSASGLSASPSSTTNATHGQLGSGGMGARPMRTISPKRLFTKATAADTSTLFSKAQDEERALQLCISKVVQRGLPMSVVAAEMQWDRRKLTFYYTASMRVDFRDLVKELFRLYKTRIWMCHLGHPSGAGV